MASLSETPLRDLPPTRPLTLGLWTTAAAAARTLLEAQASEGLVLDGGRPLGVITSRGLSRLLARHAEQTTHLAVRDIMDPVAVAPDAELLPAALRHVLAAPSRRLAVVDVKGMTVGVLAPSHVARAYGGGDELAGRTVAEAMTRTVVTARSEEMATTVLGRMARATVGSVVVVDAADKPQGLFTARDAMELLARERPLRNLRLGECMRAPVVAVSPQMGLDAALGGMDGQGGGRLAVTAAAGFLLGLLTWTDIVKVLVEACAEVEDVRHREEAAFYRDLYDNAPQGLFRMDLDGRLLTANATLARLVGFDSADTFLNRGRQIVHPLRLDLPERRELLIRALSSPQAVSFESRVFHQDGTSSRISCIVRAVRDEVGAPTHLEGACADAEGGDAPGAGLLNEESYRSIVEHQTELICRYSPEGRLILANAAFARYWGTTPEDCVAKNFQPDVPEEDRIRVANRLGALTRERPTTGFEFRVLRPDGRLRWQRWTCRAIFDAAGRLLEYQAVGRDITGRKRAEERLRAQCLFAQTLLEAMPAPVYYKDANGRFQGCNKAFESLLGMPREQVIGHDDYAVLPAEQAAVHIGKDRELIHRGGRQFYETSLETAIGQRHVLLRNSLFRDGDGNVAGIIGIALDITERKQAEVAATRIRSDLEAGLARHAEELREANSRLTAEVAERQRIEVELRRSTLFLESVLNAIQDGICVLGPDMTVLKANKAMRMLYAKHGEPEGQKCHAAFRSQPSPSAKCPFHHTLSTGKLAICSVPKLDGDEAVGWLEIYSYPLFAEDGAVSGVTEIVRDVTARKKLESELAAALELAEAGSQAKGAFLANMSHEIRTPLNAVLGYVQLMLHDSLESRQRERLTVVEESAATLLSIINDILDYSKIEAGRMEIKAEPFDLMRCLEAVIREQEVLARDKGLELTLDCDPGLPRVVRGDGLRLRQILRNLVNNAVKYTEKGGVTVTAALETVGQPEATGTRVMLRFCVTDTGLGIPEDQQATIFDSFTQVDGSLTRRQSGTGLGLAICRRLAGLMGGSLSLESQPGAGSVFYLLCPFEEVRFAIPVSRPADVEAGDATLPPLRILLVEDNRVNRMFAEDLLASRGHTVVTADDGRAALDYLATNPVDVVLMDIQMPVMDGLTATRAIRGGEPGIDPELPVIGLSAYAMDQERERFLAAGLDGYITKPIDERDFFATVRQALAKRGRTAASRKPTPPAEASAAPGAAAPHRARSELMARVGREFQISVPQQLATLETALRDSDLTVCERVAHTLKGNAAMFGAAAMRAAAARAEAAAANGDIRAVRAVAPSLAEACRAVVDNMDTFLSRLGG